MMNIKRFWLIYIEISRNMSMSNVAVIFEYKIRASVYWVSLYVGVVCLVCAPLLREDTHRLSRPRTGRLLPTLQHNISPHWQPLSGVTSTRGMNSNNSNYILHITDNWNATNTDSNHLSHTAGVAQGQKSSSSYGRVSPRFSFLR